MRFIGQFMGQDGKTTKLGEVDAPDRIAARQEFRRAWPALDDGVWLIEPIGPTGAANSSPEFLRLAATITRIIHYNAHTLIAGHADQVAVRILAHLAHAEPFKPSEPHD